jgi:serine/threonine protein kinase
MSNKHLKAFVGAFDTYTVVRQVGSGGSGTVFEAKASDAQSVALKVVDKSRTSQQKLKRFQNEIQFCLRPSSKHIVRVIDFGRTKDDSLFYVMPYYPGTLRSLIQSGIERRAALPLYAQLLDAVESAHLLNVFHRDVKPENFLHDSATNVIVLADFGIARFEEDELLATVDTGPHERLANFAYAAPEQRVPGKTVDLRADIYALGLILNEIFTGQIPQGTAFREIK